MKEFFSYILGDLSVPMLIASYIFALIGVAISLLTDAMTRNPKSEYSPVMFDWRYFLLNNWKRILLSVLLIFVMCRFTPELIGFPLSMYWALIGGLALDKVSQLIKKKTNLLTTK